MAYSEDLLTKDRLLLGQNTESAFERVANLQVQLIEKRIELTGAQARTDVLDQQLAVYRQQIDQIPNKAVLLARVQRDMETSAQLYTTVFKSLQEARIAEESELGYVDIIDKAVVPNEPISPTFPLNLLLGAVLGGIFGIVAAFGRSAIDNRVSRPEDLRAKGFATLGLVPDMRRIMEGDFEGKRMVDVGGQQISTSLVTVLTPLSQASEAFRRLRTNVDFSAPDSNKKIVLITSPEPGEGKTSTSLNLAIANAQLGRKTLFLDADLRRPTSHRLLGRSREPGLVDWLFDQSLRNRASLATQIEDLYHLPVGKAAPNPSELLGSRRMKELIQALGQEFDTVIIDSPPLLTVTDGLLLGPEVDMVLLVASSGQTHWGALERAREIMNDVGIKPNGVILNRFDAKQAYGGYGYGYGYGYGAGYGYGYGYGYGQEGLYADQEMQQVISHK